MGSQAVGKTSLVRSFLNEKFRKNYSPTTEEIIYTSNILLNKKTYILQVLDSGGSTQLFHSEDEDESEDFDLEEEEDLTRRTFHRKRMISFAGGICSQERSSQIKEADGYLMVYSSSDWDSFLEVQELFRQIVETRSTKKQETSKNPKKNKKKQKEVKEYGIVLCSNKKDIEPSKRKVKAQQGEQLAKDVFECPFFESSAKERQNINSIFSTLVLQIVENREKLNKNSKNILNQEFKISNEQISEKHYGIHILSFEDKQTTQPKDQPTQNFDHSTMINNTTTTGTPLSTTTTHQTADLDEQENPHSSIYNDQTEKKNKKKSLFVCFGRS